MRRIALSLLSLFAVSLASAQDFGLVYPGSAPLVAVPPIITAASGEGLVVSAKEIAGFGPFVAGLSGKPVCAASVVRSDTELDVAYIKLGEPLADAESQNTHRQRASAIRDFLPRPASVSGTDSAALAAEAVPAGDPFTIRINEVPVGDEPVVLKVNRKAASFDLDIVRNAVEQLWRLEVRLESAPDLRFWNRDKQRGLNSMPTKVLTFSHQALFRPLVRTAFVRIPVEASSIKGDTYTWTVKVKTKQETFEKKFTVRFEPK